MKPELVTHTSRLGVAFACALLSGCAMEIHKPVTTSAVAVPFPIIPAYVNGTHASDLTGATVPLPLPALNVHSGNAGCYTTNIAPGVTDTAGNTYTLILSKFYGGAGGSQYDYMYYASNMTAGAADVITIGLCDYPVAVVDQYSGLASTIEVASAGSGGNNGLNNWTIAAGPISTTGSNELIYAAMSADITSELVTGATAPLTMRNLTPLVANNTQGLGSADYLAPDPLTNFSPTMSGSSNGGTGNNDFVVMSVAVKAAQ